MISREKECTFDNFEVNEKNRFAYLAALDVATKADTPFNPLYLIGDRSEGKTHLLKAMKNHILCENPCLNVVYVEAVAFYCDYLEEIRNSENHYPKTFRQKTRNADVLLIDDIDFFSGERVFAGNYRSILKELNTPAEEFFHTFMTLYNKGKRIVMSANKPPVGIEDLDIMFGKQLEMGLVIGLNE